MSDGFEKVTARCGWAESSDRMRHYHDTEWGFPVADDVRLFEKMCLEGFQSGLSWATILNKRDDFRRVFAGFDPQRVAGFTGSDVATLLGDATIVRHRGKIESAVNNARRCLEIIGEFGSLGAYVWGFEPPGPTTDNDPSSRVGVISTSPESTALSRDLKRRGFTFVGPTTMYAFMQSMGLVNDHEDRCPVRREVARARRGFVVPTR